jgi:hypothetical protein
MLMKIFDHFVLSFLMLNCFLNLNLFFIITFHLIDIQLSLFNCKYLSNYPMKSSEGPIFIDYFDGVLL